ncbi:MAG: hypothetical protein K2X01_10900 [Cyanobacteria bacterium]|nr:hypothetical protein [Cyanobacteriota bacterium]
MTSLLTATEARSAETNQANVSEIVLTQHAFQLFRVHGASSTVTLAANTLPEKQPIFSGLHVKSQSIFQPYQLNPEYGTDFTQN